MDIETNKRALNTIAQSALTNSKRPQSFVEGVYPTHVIGGTGATLIDTSGKRYVDFICGLGTNLIGYGHGEIALAVQSAFRSGATLSLSTTDEIRLGEKVKEIMPFVDRIKILKSGSEGCTAAVRIARAATGRSKVLTDAYHGWHDEFASMKLPAIGITNKFDISQLGDCDVEGAACVIIEPVITDYSVSRIKYLNRLREACTKHGVILIFDETITGLRFPNFCVANWAGVSPDIIIFGKALGGGMPISVVGGKESVMNCGEYFVSSSFAGERTSICAAHRLVELLQQKYMIQDLWDSGTQFMKQFNELELGAKIEGYPTRGVLTGDPLPKALFMQEACKAGLLFGASWFYAFPHMQDFNSIFGTLKQIQLKLKIGKVRLEGNLPQSPFAQQMRGNK